MGGQRGTMGCGDQRGSMDTRRDNGIRIPERDAGMPERDAGMPEMDDYWIPEYIHDPKHIKGSSTPCPSCPVIVFINTRSGGQLGRALLQSYRRVLNDNQVYDLHTEPPQEVLKRIYGNLERLKKDGDELAKKVSEKLRLIVAGGDGTANWMLGVVCDLKLPKPPPIATVPLGTGNNLPFSFGWGKKNPGTDNSAVETFLRQVMEAKEMKIDSWHITMRMKAAEDGLQEPIPSLELPNSLHEFKRVRSTESMNKEDEHTYRGGFWNYFSVGMDAEVSYLFHSERNEHPEEFQSQIHNQGAYLKLGFSTTLFQGSSRCIKEFTKIEVMKKPRGSWVCIDIPSGIKSVICLNLPSFSGGYNPWGIPNKKCDFTQVYVDDGLIEVVGFHNAIHGLFLLSHKGHGNRLAQAHKVRFTFSKHPTGDTYMRMDGEPWKQSLPKNGTVELEISHNRQVNILAHDKCVSKSKGSIDTSTPSTSIDDDEIEEARKFGVAETFKLPEDIDIASLS